MAEVENDCFPSKRIRLSPEREENILNESTEQFNVKQDPVIDGEPFLANYSDIQSSNVEPSSSREQDGGDNEFHKHDQFEGDDFPSCFSVEDDIDNTEEHHYQPIAGPMGWVQRQMNLGINPREILSYMVPHAKVPSDLQDDHLTLWKIVIDLLTSPSPRQKLDHVNTIDDVVSLLNGCKNIVVLTGAGVSVSCGIPDFRSRDGIYARLSEEYPDLPDPQAMFDITYFNQNPYPFFKFAKEIYPGQFKPSLSHRFIRQIEKHGSLLRNYSQNIDTLEQIAGISNVIQCHGSFSTASCTNCKYKVSSADIKEDIFNQRIPQCTKCKPPEEALAIMKPDIVFFGENLPSDFYHHLEDDSEKADLLIVIGSSLKVRPVALIPSRIDADVPQILINREPLRHMTFDVELLGDCDVILAELCKRLGDGWTDILQGAEPCPVDVSLYPSSSNNAETSIVGDSHEMPSDSANTDAKCSLNLEDLSNTEYQSLPKNTAASTSDEKQNQEDCQSTPNTDDDMNQTSDEQLEIPSKCPLSSDSTTVPSNVLEFDGTNVQALGGTSVQSVGQDTSCVSTDEKREGLMVPIATENHNKHDSSLHNDNPSIFVYHPPSRYIFYGAEITNSPVHSPFGSPLPSDDDNSDNCSDNGSLSRDDLESTNLEANGYSSSGDGSEGYGSGVMSSTDLTSYDLKLITGALGSYHCVSEDNSVMSGLDLITEGNSEYTKENLLNVSDFLAQNSLPPSSVDPIGNSNGRTDSISDILRDSSHSDESFQCDSNLDSLKPGWMS